MALFTVLGAKGFIGSRLSAALTDGGHEVFAPSRGARLNDRPLGHVIYAIGVTGDFRSRPLDTMAAHVCRLLEVLGDGSFESLTYLSSTRVYQRVRAVGAQGVDETAAIGADPLDPGDLYNLSKLSGESLCLHGGRPAQVVRLSNVYGAGDESQNFLSSIIRDAVQTGHVTLTAAAESAKDYVSLEDVVTLLPRIALGARGGIYNLASGTEHLARRTGRKARRSSPAARSDTRLARWRRFFRGSGSLAWSKNSISARPRFSMTCPRSLPRPARFERWKYADDRLRSRQGPRHRGWRDPRISVGQPRGVRRGEPGLAPLRLGHEIRLQLHLDGPADHPVARRHGADSRSDLHRAARRDRSKPAWPTAARWSSTPACCKAMDRGRVIGIDVEIRPHNRSRDRGPSALPTGSSWSKEARSIRPWWRKVHAHGQTGRDRAGAVGFVPYQGARARELEAYGPLVTPGSYIVATDGIMDDLAGAPRSSPDWTWNNPSAAAREFVERNADVQDGGADLSVQRGGGRPAGHLLARRVLEASGLSRRMETPATNEGGLVMSTLPLVSIGMPVYNGMPHFREAVDALLRQTYAQRGDRDLGQRLGRRHGRLLPGAGAGPSAGEVFSQSGKRRAACKTFAWRSNAPAANFSCGPRTTTSGRPRT